MRPGILRWLAIAIAIVAVIDPAVTSSRTLRPEISVIASDSARDALLVARVARELGERFTVIPAPFAPAAATVLIGARLPASARAITGPTFAVRPDARRPAATIEAVNAPARSALDARVPITATVRVSGASGQTLETTLRLGDAVIDRVTQPVTDDGRHVAALTFIPTAVGAVPLRVSTRLVGADQDGAEGASDADIVIDVRDDRWGVLFFDPRPSWLSTFVRRTVERDARFAVTSRVVTSRYVSIDAGRPPSTLGDPAALAAFDAIVVGAAQVLSERDVAGLESFLRRRGGTVILLVDERANGAYDRLTRVRQWNGTTAAAGFTLSPVGGDSARLRATALTWPATLPAGARVLATASTGGAERPIVWRAAVGGGQLIVSGALDAWRYRDPSQSAFDAFWRMTVADAAAAGSMPIELELDSPIVEPGDRVVVGATVRALALADGMTRASSADSITATIESTSGATREPSAVSITLRPDRPAGRFTGSFRAPATPGSYRLTVADGATRADVPLLVAMSPARAQPNESDLVAAWVASRGGKSFDESALDDLRPALEGAMRPAARMETWYPMRSAWWIVPFALLLGAEWLARRRSGLA